MVSAWFRPDRVFDGADLHDDMAICIEDGRVVALDRVVDAKPLTGLVTPGFVDLQVNGGGGVLLNQNPTVEGMQKIAAAHLRFGTVSIMPTVITDTPEIMARAVDAALAVAGEPWFAGLHIEGPHIAMARRGTHDPRFIRELDEVTIGHVQRLRDADLRVMITLAPEAATLDQIAALVRMGAIVSLGHSDATAEVAQDAFEAGATCATHLFNAMSPMQGRAPGLVGAAINHAEFAGIICDGVHVADEMVGLAIRARPKPDSMFLVSDAMPTVGGPDAFDLYGRTVRLQNGRLVNDEGNLAGAHVTQAKGVARLVNRIGLSPESALRMAITTPGNVINRPDLARMVGRDITDIVVLNDKFEVRGALPDIVDIDNQMA